MAAIFLDRNVSTEISMKIMSDPDTLTATRGDMWLLI